MYFLLFYDPIMGTQIILDNKTIYDVLRRNYKAAAFARHIGYSPRGLALHCRNYPTRIDLFFQFTMWLVDIAQNRGIK